MTVVRELVKRLIAENPVMVFSKSYCPYCVRTKDLFDDLNTTYKAVELNDHDKGVEIQEELKSLTGQRTVPNVFIHGRHIGGFDALTNANEAGKLKEYLEQNPNL
ncbi:glutaredoxin [Basidiobolus meristosporus CBS 931.73]|uniref:Glutaredoxin n=1 Tax=Basidiobolus meristosporus CBS 931.73 TaxID=1314790 RepID=A0A1Y1XT50_9FUNG|nr:glutaredoxin [Basidiobolus meristosporus CBS 931.73]|eukprot:ORX88474.1 glutaredoxin [Basidiobolus meristosporus CBS 931.73]